MQKIKSALQRIETSQVILLQFWGLKEIEGRKFLTTSGQPFGLRYLYKGLCWYRKHCQAYKYCVDKDKQEAGNSHLFGPPARVFQQKLPESSTHVGYYTNEEFPMRDYAVRCGVRTYLSLPVFEPIQRNCIGVIELVTVWKGGYLTYEVERVLNALEGVDLKCPKLYLQKGRKVQEASKQIEREEIKRTLKFLRETHKLPFVRVWIPCVNLEMDENGRYVGCNTEDVISAGKEVYYVADEEMDANDHVYDDYYYDDMLCFRDISKLQPLQKDQGAVGKAFLSGKLCYCKNITEFSITEYPLVHYARWCGLTSSVAICLKNNDEVYILELFLPPDNGDPKTLLESILSTVGQHFQNFKFASGQELGHESDVQLIKASSEKNLDYFHISQTRASRTMSEVLLNEEGRNQLIVQSDVVNSDPLEKHCVSVTPLQKENRTRTKDSVSYDDLKQHFNKNLSDAAEILQVSRSTLKRLCRKYGIKRWPLSKRKKTGEPDHQPSTFPETKKKTITSSTTTITHDISSSITVKAAYGDDMMKFRLFNFSRKDDLDKEVAKRLQLPIGKFRIKYMDDDNDWIWIACDDDLSDCFSNAQLLGKNTIRMVVSPAAMSHHLEL